MREMKDSGIEWIRIIPQSWDVRRGKTILKLKKRSPQKYGPEDVITCFRDGEVTLRRNRREEGFTFSDKEIGYQGIHKGDLVIHGMDGFAGAIGVSDSDGKASPVLVVCDSDQNNRFLMYYLRMLASQNVFLALATGIRERSCDLRWNKIADLLFPLPPLEEQKRIVEYLDNKCSKIDSIIEQQQILIEKLKKYKLSIITEVVTKGLNPDVELKDCHVYWLRRIPNNWDIKRIKHIYDYIESGVSVNAGGNPAEAGEYGVLKTSCVSKFEFDPSENKSVNADETARVSCPVCQNTIIVSRMNTPELVGACGYVEESIDNIFLPDRLWQVHFRDGVNVKYVWYYLRSENIRFYYSSLSMGTSSSMQNISQGDFLNAYIPLPSLKEQDEIVNYLDRVLTENKKQISERKKLIEKLQEYKKSLIYEVVTGKKEV